jgi:signal peptidase II
MQKAFFLLYALILIAADQLSKWGVSEHVIRPRVAGGTTPLNFLEWYLHPPASLPYVQVEVTSFFNLVMIWNKGISFGLFNQDINYGPIILIAISLLITLIFLIVLLRSPVSWNSAGMVLIIAGALGNVIDRFRFGAVIDFLDFHIGGSHWPAFNVADSCICVGVALMIILGLFFDTSKGAKS